MGIFYNPMIELSRNKGQQHLYLSLSTTTKSNKQDGGRKRERDQRNLGFWKLENVAVFY